ncbi:MAG: hypothetical protein KBC84_05710 [Proteobacteria bacterium]|nr:hypothetical protein [Pseudomonadota bacterium]
MKIQLFLSLALLFTLSCSNNKSSLESDINARERSEIWKTENPNCQVRGNTANWQTAYCMWLNQTNEAKDELVEQCYKMLTAHKAIPEELCARNLFFKTEICKTLVLDQYFDNSLEDCIKSDDSIPKVVKEGL